MPTYDMSHMPGFIDLHQDMLSGVAQLDGDFPIYGSSYLTGAPHAAAMLSSMFPHDPGRSLIAELEAHNELLASHSSALRLVTTADDLRSDDVRVGVLPHSEGFELPSIGPDTLDYLWAEHSLRSLALTWNHETEYAFSCYDDGASRLKPEGQALVRALAQSPLLFDLAHINEAGFYEALELYSAPVLVTHTFCRAIVEHPRGLDDDQLRALGEHGGLVGLAFVPEFLGEHGSIDEALRHIERIATLAGESAVSIGSDWGVADMGELGGPASLPALIEAVSASYGPALAEKFAFANAYEFLSAQLPAA